VNRVLEDSASVKLLLQRTEFCIHYEKRLPYYGAATVQVGIQIISNSNITHTHIFYVCFSVSLTLRDMFSSYCVTSVTFRKRSSLDACGSETVVMRFLQR
jgi:hypothetical protein